VKKQDSSSWFAIGGMSGASAGDRFDSRISDDRRDFLSFGRLDKGVSLFYQ